MLYSSYFGGSLVLRKNRRNKSHQVINDFKKPDDRAPRSGERGEFHGTWGSS